MSKHTPGPWAVQKAEDCMGRKLDDMVRWVITADDHGLWISTGPTWDPEHAEESEANARLIAAAPELLEALSKKVNDAEQRMFEDWLEFNSPSGDHESVQRQWLESNDYRGFIGEWREQIEAIAKATAP